MTYSDGVSPTAPLERSVDAAIEAVMVTKARDGCLGLPEEVSPSSAVNVLK